MSMRNAAPARLVWGRSRFEPSECVLVDHDTAAKWIEAGETCRTWGDFVAFFEGLEWDAWIEDRYGTMEEDRESAPRPDDSMTLGTWALEVREDVAPTTEAASVASAWIHELLRSHRKEFYIAGGDSNKAGWDVPLTAEPAAFEYAQEHLDDTAGFTLEHDDELVARLFSNLS